MFASTSVFDNVAGEQCHSSGADQEATHSSQRWVMQLVYF
jgi:hypothetical protein